MSLLEIDRLSVSFGQVSALRDVTLAVEQGEILGLAGESGCGKSTLGLAVMGLLPLKAGSVRLDGRDLSNLAPHQRARAGIGYVPQGHQVFPHLSTRQNLEVVAGRSGRFDPIVISGDHGFRKPDRRLFQFALDGMGVAAENTIYVGNDMHRDIYGAREAGLTTVMFDSDQGTKRHEDCVPDHTIYDHRDLLKILDLEPEISAPHSDEIAH